MPDQKKNSLADCDDCAPPDTFNVPSLKVDPSERIFWMYCIKCMEVKLHTRNPQFAGRGLETVGKICLKNKCSRCNTRQHLRGFIHTRREASETMREMELSLLIDPLDE